MGRYIRSNEKNGGVPVFKLPSNKKSEERAVTRDSSIEGPGPGSYTPCESNLTSRFKNLNNISLYPHDRKIELHDKTKIDLP